MSTDIELVGKALAEFDTVAAGLEQLNKTYKGMLFDVETYSGMELAKASRAVLRKPRYEIERIRKEAKAPLLAIGKKLDAEASRITAEILKLEEPIDQQIKSEEARKENEKLAALAAEQKRKDDIHAKIDAIRAWPTQATTQGAESVAKLLETAKAYAIDTSFMEFAATAQTALDTSRQALSGILAERIAQAAELARVQAEREELAKLRAAEEQRQAAERARLAEEERAAKAARDAEAARQAAELKKQREELDARAAEQRKQQEAEEARLKAAREQLKREQAEARRKAEEVENQRIAAEKAEQDRRAAAALAAKKATYPGDKAIVDALAFHFGVTEQVVHGWLARLNSAKAAA